MNARSLARPGLLTFGLALSASVACGGYELLPATDSVAIAASSIESIAPTGNASGSGMAGYLVSGTSVQYMGPGCERVRRPSCNRPGRRSTHR
jgi:hypothetical protein